MVKRHKWILILIVWAIFIMTAGPQGRCDERLSQEARVNKIVDAYNVENIAANFLYVLYMHYYLEELVDLHIDDPSTKVEIGPMGTVIGLENMRNSYVGTDRAKVPSAVSDHPTMHIHEMNGMVLEVAGDGKTAQIMFNSTGREGAGWAWIKYGIDFKKNEDDLWKLWHVNVYCNTANMNYLEDWADTKGYMNDPGVGMMPGRGMPGMEGAEGPPGGMPGMGEGGMPGDGMPGEEMPTGASSGGGFQSMRDATDKWLYTGGTSEVYSSIPPLWPVPPIPTETWDPEKSY
jgi:hypothetical protein